jgi:hypothetical protein
VEDLDVLQAHDAVSVGNIRPAYRMKRNRDARWALRFNIVHGIATPASPRKEFP